LQLERFLIANRGEYLQHSSQNYTLQQKQYNNWLTDRLIELATNYNYVFDSNDFSYVAIRDRIRCYYKSYVQTARKRGMPLPANIQIPSTQKKKRPKTEDDGDDKSEGSKDEEGGGGDGEAMDIASDASKAGGETEENKSVRPTTTIDTDVEMKKKQLSEVAEEAARDTRKSAARISDDSERQHSPKGEAAKATATS